jgi:hypothetical protein
MARTLTGLVSLTDHVCAACFGRIVRGERPLDCADDHAHRWTCTNCGAETVHREVSSICSCGIRTKTGRDAGVRCERNPTPTPEFPSLIVAAQSVPA